jgi:RimJ/RimL family protein N-acetyltransferase
MVPQFIQRGYMCDNTHISPPVGCTIKPTMDHTLEDGTPVVIRPIRAADKAELLAGLQRLSPKSVHQRFLSPKPSLSRAELRYLTEVDGHDHVAFVAEEAARPGRIVGVGRYVRLAGEPMAAEAAITVGDCLQRRGLGSLLAEDLAHAAAENGIARFTATMLADNLAAHRLMRRLTHHLELRSRGAGSEELVAELAA